MAPSIKVTLGLALLFIFLFVDGTLAKNTIYNGESLNTEEYLENEPYKFVMQGDCNLVLYKDYGKTAIWSTHTEGKGKNCQAALLNNGKLVVVGDSGTVLWNSGKTDYPNIFRLVLQSDGNVVIYGASLWHTNTAQSPRKEIDLMSVTELEGREGKRIRERVIGDWEIESLSRGSDVKAETGSGVRAGLGRVVPNSRIVKFEAVTNVVIYGYALWDTNIAQRKEIDLMRVTELE
ncbi:hypothetical protein Sjap_004220 [Stephania japonica]|uniref:Bulb-type lectin domain-containing protein n=1 Tax=Stephania japonica TaxID=461633 RepID=A0AAP0K422_9MAGN